MSDISIRIPEMRQESCEMNAGYMYLRSSAAATYEVVHELEKMSSFAAEIQRLKKARKEFYDQADTLRRMQRVFDSVLDQYQQCEERNLAEVDGTGWKDEFPSHLFSAISSPLAKAVLYSGTNSPADVSERLTVSTQPMIPNSVIGMLTQDPAGNEKG